MSTIIKRVSIAVLLGLVMQQGRAAESDIVDGFTEFLVDRANANLVAIFERRLKSDQNFKCYFPNTYEKIERLRLEDLFNSRTYWEDSLETDLEVLQKRIFFVEAQRSFALIDADKITEVLSKFDYEYDGKNYRVGFYRLDTPTEVIDQINGFWDPITAANQKIESWPIFDNACEISPGNELVFDRLLASYDEIVDDLEDWLDHLGNYGSNLRLRNEGQRDLYCRLNKINADDCARVDVDVPGMILQLLGDSQPGQYADGLRIARRVTSARAELERLENLSNSEKTAIERVIEQLPLLVENDSSEGDLEDIERRLREAQNGSREESRKALIGARKAIKQHFKTDDIDYVRLSADIQAVVDSDRSHTDRALVALELLEESDQVSEAEIERLRRSVM